MCSCVVAVAVRLYFTYQLSLAGNSTDTSNDWFSCRSSPTADDPPLRPLLTAAQTSPSTTSSGPRLKAAAPSSPRACPAWARSSTRSASPRRGATSTTRACSPTENPHRITISTSTPTTPTTRCTCRATSPSWPWFREVRSRRSTSAGIMATRPRSCRPRGPIRSSGCRRTARPFAWTGALRSRGRGRMVHRFNP